MTPQQIAAAVEWASELGKRWLAPARSPGYELYRLKESLRALTTAPSSVEDECSITPPGGPVPVFGTRDEQTYLIYDDSKGESLIAKACKGDPDADAVLCGFASEFIRRGCLLPEHLRDYIADQLYERSTSEKRKRGRDKHANGRRNYYICEAVSGLIEQGFSPTRNETTEDESACSIISQALKRHGIDLSERGVAKVWNQRPLPIKW